jgi:hypothetical protein
MFFHGSVLLSVEFSFGDAILNRFEALPCFFLKKRKIFYVIFSLLGAGVIATSVVKKRISYYYMTIITLALHYFLEDIKKTKDESVRVIA